MKTWLENKYRKHESFFTDDPDTLIGKLTERWNDLLFISLDHDLFERKDGNTEICGMPVARFLSTRSPVCPVFIHSSNTIEAEKMVRILAKKHWPVKRVIPFDDTSWIADDWIPSIKSSLKTFTPPPFADATGTS